MAETEIKFGKSGPEAIPVVSKFPMGYRNREDITNLPPGVLVVGSQNVITNVSERVQVRQGYTLDGAGETINAPILSSFDWITRGNGERHLRAGYLTSAGNDGKLQFRYEDSAGTVTWKDLKTALTTVSLNFTTFWDTTEVIRVMLWVDGSSNINEWSGAVTEVASSTSTTLTKTGTETWAEAGFYTAKSGRAVVINGTSYTYTGGENTTTLTGLSSVPTVTSGDVVWQATVVTANSTMTDLPATFPNDLISVFQNQVFIGSLTRPQYYLSKVNNYKNYSFGSPRLPGDGGTSTLDDNLVGFVPQENEVYITAGMNLWYKIGFTKSTTYNGSAAVIVESIDTNRLKTTPQQAARSQAFLSQMKNDVIMITNEPTMDTLGRVTGVVVTPQTTNLSDPIKLDFDSYNFDDGSIFYWRYYILVAVPKEDLIRIYNLATKSWEAPQTIPVSRFYTVNGELYGHSYLSSESYKLFDGYSDRASDGVNGSPINAIARFSYQQYGSRTNLKNTNAFYMEGYINANTTLLGQVVYESDGCQTIQAFEVDGSDSQIVCVNSSYSSFGKYPLGSEPMGSQITNSLTGLPPKFRVFKTFPPKDFFECQFVFSISGIDQRFELLANGLS